MQQSSVEQKAELTVDLRVVHMRPRAPTPTHGRGGSDGSAKGWCRQRFPTILVYLLCESAVNGFSSTGSRGQFHGPPRASGAAWTSSSLRRQS